jgi:hypothetical protein
MTCKCERLLKVQGHCSDCCCIYFEGLERNGYVPYGLGIGGGDDIEFILCVDCGQIQGKFPIKEDKLAAAFSKETNEFE